MPENPLPLKSCGVLVVTGEPIKKFLLMKHADRLDLPKGHMDAGETELQCALRELEEETGIQADDVEVDGRFRFQTSYPVRNRRTGGQMRDKTLVVFLARLIRDVPIRPTEHLDFEWVNWSPPHVLQTRTIDPLLRHLAEFLKPGKA